MTGCDFSLVGATGMVALVIAIILVLEVAFIVILDHYFYIGISSGIVIGTEGDTSNVTITVTISGTGTLQN